MGGRAGLASTITSGNRGLDSPPHPDPPHRKRGEGETRASTVAALAFGGMIALTHAVTPAVAAGDRALGEHLSSECAACHQISGRQVGGIPAIVGYPADQFLALMDAYRNKDRDNQVMQTIAGRLTREELAALAAYYEGVKPTK